MQEEGLLCRSSEDCDFVDDNLYCQVSLVTSEGMCQALKNFFLFAGPEDRDAGEPSAI